MGVKWVTTHPTRLMKQDYETRLLNKTIKQDYETRLWNKTIKQDY